MLTKLFHNEKALYTAIRIEIILLVVLAVFAGYFTKRDLAGRSEIQQAGQLRYQSYLLADQLRQSSDDLTRMVRSYVATGDSRFEQYFSDILDIRDGKKPRPEHYERIYWDLITSNNPAIVPPAGEQVALKTLMEDVGFTEKEFQLLAVAKRRSDKLVALEQTAMQAMKGRFKDSEGKFSIAGEPAPEIARRVVFGSEYHEAKQSIMLPINEFFKAIDTRTTQSVREAQKKSIRFLWILVFLVTLFTFGGILLLATVRQYQNLLIQNLQNANALQAKEIVKRRKAEKRAQQGEEIINKSPVAVFLWKNEDNMPVEYASGNVTDLFGHSADDFTSGKVLYSAIVHPKDIDRITDDVRRDSTDRQSTEIVHEPYRIITPDGQIRWIDDHTSIERDKNGNVTHFLGLILDITERKQTDQLRKEKEAAELANKAKSEFLANMSHELRTPMHGILSYSSFGIQRINKVPTEKILEYFHEIADSGKRLMVLLNDLLDLAKLEAGKMNYTMSNRDINEIVHLVGKEFSASIQEKGLFLQQKIPSEALTLPHDVERIGQVLRNLLSNSIKFTKAGNGIVIKAEKTSVIENAEQQAVVNISVIDQGVGIPSRELETVFDKFIQSSKTKTGAGGTGLGLAICKQIVEDHGGRIRAENNPDGGAVFSFTIPMIN